MSQEPSTAIPGVSRAKGILRVVAVLASFNRREQTLECMRSLKACEARAPAVRLSIVLVDDGSNDGTVTAVSKLAPDVRILEGDGSLYWCGAMRLAMIAAGEFAPDLYWWINDDVRLESDALARMLAVYPLVKEGGPDGTIVVGSTLNPATGLATYGGRVRSKRLRPLYLDLVQPGDRPISCDTMNGNCVLIPRVVVDRIGVLDDHFIHGLGDWDYGFRAAQAGFRLLVCPGYVGSCSPGVDRGDSGASFTTARVAWRKITGPKAYPPASWLTFTRRHGGPFWIFNWAFPYVRAVTRGLLKGGF
jgi:GT2 family glycosyltransferase